MVITVTPYAETCYAWNSIAQSISSTKVTVTFHFKIQSVSWGFLVMCGLTDASSLMRYAATFFPHYLKKPFILSFFY